MTAAAPPDLPEVLRRARADELQPLCALLRVPSAGRTRDALARALHLALRMAGSRHIANVVRGRREPDAWHEVVDRLAEQVGAVPGGEPAFTERRVLEAWARRGRPRPVPAAEIAEVLAAGWEPAPGEALQPVRRGAVSRSVPQSLLMGLSRFLLVFIGPLLMLGVVYLISRPREGVLLRAVLEVARLRVRVGHRFTLALVGPPSVGKDAAMKAIFGFDTGNVSPIAGSTRRAAAWEVPGERGLEVLNTPGVGDTDSALTDETRGLLDGADLFLFMVNAQGGVRQREKEEFERVRARRRPVLVVVNKLDTLRAPDRERFLADCAAKLGLPREAVVGAAFDPLPALADAPFGVAEVHAWLRARLGAAGRDPAALDGLLAGAATVQV